MPQNKTINNDSGTFKESSDAFSAMLIQFIKVKEGVSAQSGVSMEPARYYVCPGCIGRDDSGPEKRI